MDFSDDQIERYARHIILKEIGGAGQQRLLAAKVLVVGAGGLGSPLLMYLAAAGVGTLGIVDDDTVSLSNLQRQILHHTADIGRPKTASAAESIAALNPDVTVVAHEERLTAANAIALVSAYDLVADGSDNFETRFLVNDACRAFDADNPCYRCVFPERPPPGTVPSCAEAGVIGALAGVMGSLQAVEVIKEITGIGQSMAGRLTIYDALDARFRTLKLRRDPGCALCGEHATIHDLAAHAA